MAATTSHIFLHAPHMPPIRSPWVPSRAKLGGNRARYGDFYRPPKIAPLGRGGRGSNWPVTPPQPQLLPLLHKELLHGGSSIHGPVPKSYSPWNPHLGTLFAPLGPPYATPYAPHIFPICLPYGTPWLPIYSHMNPHTALHILACFELPTICLPCTSDMSPYASHRLPCTSHIPCIYHPRYLLSTSTS